MSDNVVVKITRTIYLKLADQEQEAADFDCMFTNSDIAMDSEPDIIELGTDVTFGTALYSTMSDLSRHPSDSDDIEATVDHIMKMLG